VIFVIIANTEEQRKNDRRLLYRVMQKTDFYRVRLKNDIQGRPV